jgi:hypothetical protein
MNATRDEPDTPVIQPAAPQLIALAVAMRPGWDPEDLDMAILAATQAGWDWERTAREVWRLAWTEDGSPASLRAACRSPFERPSGGGRVPARAGTGLPITPETRALVDAYRQHAAAANDQPGDAA